MPTLPASRVDGEAEDARPTKRRVLGEVLDFVDEGPGYLEGEEADGIYNDQTEGAAGASGKTSWKLGGEIEESRCEFDSIKELRGEIRKGVNQGMCFVRRYPRYPLSYTRTIFRIPT